MTDNKKSPEQILAEWVIQCEQHRRNQLENSAVIYDAKTTIPPIEMDVVGVIPSAVGTPSIFRCWVESIMLSDSGLSAHWSCSDDYSEPDYWFFIPQNIPNKKL